MTHWITQVNDDEFSATHASGIIANQYTAKSVETVGFRILHYPRFKGSELKEIGQVERRERLEALLNVVQPGDMVIVQYPLWINNFNFELEFVSYLRDVRKAKVVALVWDVISWVSDGRKRDYSNDGSLKILNEFNLVIAPNPKMIGRLRVEGKVRTPMLSMDLSDFVYEGPTRKHHLEKQIYYVAAGIDKAFVNEYEATTPINFIGQNSFGADLPDYINLLGQMESSEIPFNLGNGFGLLYYPIGDQRYKGKHYYGQFNNPMKLSLYLASGLPVITLANTAHAKWIKEQGGGLVIEELSELDAAVNKVTPAQYDQMIENLEPWKKAVSTGFFSKQAALEAINFIELGYTERINLFLEEVDD
ncbi:beta-1,6-galactofuranosyltransferase [Weissella muntiaci]|uniref:Beta-1,6-galactofuranosyltransferase n=1 Tax=Weissella muntiaci TaxID=2508881 RepID=A0A6C2C9S2_9LACO|nr:beta-1,6-galactofuranosyltransferase [Weissella muntiaci]TYC50657.1 beta-1,6-galactofuranosyltransferase [Weissella muntiaci]